MRRKPAQLGQGTELRRIQVQFRDRIYPHSLAVTSPCLLHIPRRQDLTLSTTSSELLPPSPRVGPEGHNQQETYYKCTCAHVHARNMWGLLSPSFPGEKTGSEVQSDLPKVAQPLSQGEEVVTPSLTLWPQNASSSHSPRQSPGLERGKGREEGIASCPAR